MKDEIKALMNAKKNYKRVFEGWTNLAKDKFNLLSKEDKKIVEERKSICESCIFNSVNAKEKLGYESTLVYEHCSSCKCPIPAKIMSLESNCGLDEFSMNPNDESVKHILEYYQNNNEEISWKWFAKHTPFIHVDFNNIK